MRQTVVTITNSCMYWIVNGPIVTLVNSDPLSNANALYCFGADPKRITASCWRKNETPSALINGAIRERAFLTKRPVREALDDDAQGSRSEHRSEEHQQDRRRDRDLRIRCASEPGQHEVADVRPDHEDLAVREVQELQDPVDHRVADGDEPVQAPERQPGDELVEEVAPGELEVLEVRDQLHQ